MTELKTTAGAGTADTETLVPENAAFSSADTGDKTNARRETIDEVALAEWERAAALLAGTLGEGETFKALQAAAQATAPGDMDSVRDVLGRMAASALSRTEADALLRLVRASQAPAPGGAPSLAALKEDLRSARAEMLELAGVKDDAKERQPNSTDLLLEMMASAGWVPWLDDRSEELFVEVRPGVHVLAETKTFRIEATALWRRCIGEKGQRVPPEEALHDAARALEADAREMHSRGRGVIRYAPLPRGEQGVVIDLGDETHEAVWVDALGWRIVRPDALHASDIRFVRPFGSLALPRPIAGVKPDDAIASLAGLVSVAEPRLLFGTLLTSMQPAPLTLPIIALLGDPGAGKTATARRIKALLDPSATGIATAPETTEAMAMMLANARCCVIDNATRLDGSVSDLLCVYSSAGTVVRRKLYTTADRAVLPVHGTAIFTSIRDDLFVRSDLLDRALLFRVEKPTERLSEAEMEARFEVAAPTIMGGIMNALVEVYSRINLSKSSGGDRLVHHVLILQALDAAGIGGGASTHDHAETRAAGAREYLADDGVTAAVISVLLSAPVVTDSVGSRHVWNGPPTALFNAASSFRSGNGYWPADAKRLSRALKASKPVFTAAGVGIEHTRNNSARSIMLSVSTLNADRLRDALLADGHSAEGVFPEMDPNII